MQHIENPMVIDRDEGLRSVGLDALGVLTWEGDEILIMDDDFFAKGELSDDAIKILEMYGAYTTLAQ